MFIVIHSDYEIDKLLINALANVPIYFISENAEFDERPDNIQNLINEMVHGLSSEYSYFFSRFFHIIYYARYD